MSIASTKGWPSDLIAVRGKLYGRCADCGSLVRVNKPLFGSWHVCAPESEGDG